MIGVRLGQIIEYYTYTNEDGKAVKTETDLGLLDEDLQEYRPWLGWVFIKIHSPDEAGWCSTPECDLLLGLQNDLTGLLKEQRDAINSGVRMQDGWLELFFYLPTAKKFANTAAEVMRGYGKYSFETGTSKDANWNHYRRELYPDALMLQQIKSRIIIDELLAAGDDLSQPREVEHYLFCQTEAQIGRVAEALSASGFVLKEMIDQEGEFSYGVILRKSHELSEKSLMELTRGLQEAVQSEHGIYEGWSTTLAT